MKLKCWKIVCEKKGQKIEDSRQMKWNPSSFNLRNFLLTLKKFYSTHKKNLECAKGQNWLNKSNGKRLKNYVFLPLFFPLWTCDGFTKTTNKSWISLFFWFQNNTNSETQKHFRAVIRHVQCSKKTSLIYNTYLN